MTTVNISLYVPSQTGEVPAVWGKVEFHPTARITIEDGVILPSPFTVELDELGQANVELEPTNIYFAWRVREFIHGGENYYISVPESADVLNLEDLTRIDPDTLTPVEQFAAWNELEAEINDLQDQVNSISSLTWRGEWNNTTEYHIKDIVSYQGATYISTSINIGDVPNTSGWSWDTFIPAPTAVRYTPVLAATGLTYTGSGTTAPGYDSHYVKNGQLVTFNIKINLSTVTNFGTGQIKLTGGLPFAPLASASSHFAAWAWINPANPADELNGHIQVVADHLPNSTTLDLHWIKETTAQPKPVIESLLVQGTPVTFTTNSVIYINGTYITEGI